MLSSQRRRLREALCVRWGHKRVHWQGQARCVRCGNVRPLYGPPTGALGEEYRDDTDPDPLPM
jgi:hypothetical protein